MRLTFALSPIHRAKPPFARPAMARLCRARSGLAAMEFALSLPVLLTIGLGGTEVAYMAMINLQVSQIATSTADNASRLGQTDNSGVTPTITEKDIDSVMFGAVKPGESINFTQKGRIILSSLERDPATGKQFIHWQRCRGNLVKTSAYGNDTNANGLNGPAIPGMGSGAQKTTAAAGSAVMFAEVYYRYVPSIAPDLFGTIEFKGEAAYVIRDARNLTPGITGGGGASLCT